MTNWKQYLKECETRKNRAKSMRASGMTFASIGKKLGVTRQRVQQMLASGQRKA